MIRKCVQHYFSHLIPDVEMNRKLRIYYRLSHEISGKEDWKGRNLVAILAIIILV
jgi:hypothetical protein